MSVISNCAALPTANAGQHATSNCKPRLFWFPCKAVSIRDIVGALYKCMILTYLLKVKQWYLKCLKL